MDLADFDLGLMLALEALLEERNVTRAAARLKITQPALSARLVRLRALLDDPLFLPAASGRGVTPTARAIDLSPGLAEALKTLRGLLDGPAVFDPLLSRRTFVVAIADNPAVTLAPGLVARLVAGTRGARLALVNKDRRDLPARLESGEVDIAVGLAEEAAEDLVRRPLLADEFLTAQRKGHSRGTGPLDLDAFCALDHLLISADGGGFSGVVDAALQALGRERRVAVSIQSYALAPVILARSDCVCTLPRRFLARFSADLDAFAPPVDLPAFRLLALWHRRNQGDSGHLWLRERLFEAARDERPA